MTSPEHARRLLTAADPATTATLDRADLTELRATPQHADARLDPILDAAPDRAARRAQVVDLSTRRRLGRRTSIALSLAVLTAAGGTAAAVNLLREPAPEVSGVGCVVDAKTTAFIGATTQDPMEACRAELRRYGRDLAPDAAVYREPGKQLAVGPRSSMPREAKVVEHGPVTDSRNKELRDAIEDTVTGAGLGSPCRTEAQARSIAEAARTRLGITAFPVAADVYDDTTAKAAQGTCYTATLMDSEGRISIDRRDKAKLDDARPSPRGAADVAVMRRAAEAAAKGARDADGAQAIVRAIEAVAAAQHRERGVGYDVVVSPTKVGDTVRVYETWALTFAIYVPQAG